MNKRVNYMQLLKESVAGPNNSEHDTSTYADVMGPFLDPILGYDGGGELPTHKDAASILERYYFKNNADPGVRVNREDAEIPQVGGDKGALPDEPEEVDDSKDDIEDAVMMDESADEVENAVIERLIAEMEGDMLEEIGGPDPDQDPAAEFHEPSGDPDDDDWDELISGDAHDKMPPPAKIEERYELDLELFDILEAEEITAGDEETPDDDKDEDEDEDKDENADEMLDADKEVTESGAPVSNPRTADELEESFDIFSEAFLSEDDDKEDDDKDEDKEDDDKDEDDKDDDDDVADLDEHDIMV